jgi:N-acetylglucosamine-6-phosphate deacetylase
MHPQSPVKNNVQNATNSEKSDNVLGIHKGNYCNIIKKGAQQSIALTVVRICVICQIHKFEQMPWTTVKSVLTLA